MADMIQIRRDTASNWTSVNPILAQGELGAETDTSKLKIGDGATAWTSLGYLVDTGGYAAYGDTTANFTGTLQNSGSNVLVDTDIGVTVQGYNQDTAGTAAKAVNIAGGSVGTIPYQTAADTTAMLAVGTAGQVLQTNGAGAPTWVDAAGGAMVFLSEVTTAGASTVDFSNVFDATYDVYKIVATNIGGTVTNTQLLAHNEINGTFSAFGYYNRLTGANPQVFQYGGGTAFLSNHNNTGSDAQRTNFIATIQNPISTNVKSVMFEGVSYCGFDAIGGGTNILGNLASTTTADMTGIRFLTSSGNISGTFRLYGIAKS